MKTEFDDALRGIYHDHDEVHGDEKTVDYKQIGTLAVCSLVAAGVSILSYFWVSFLFVALAGIVFGVLGLRKIMKAPEEVSGLGLTLTGTILSSLILVSASIWQIWTYYHNAPPGYQVIQFESLALDPKTGKVPDNIAALDGHKVYIQGFMYPTNRMSGIEDFTMVRTVGHCKYCSPGINPADRIYVAMEKGTTVNYRANKPIHVGGILSVNQDFGVDEIPYSIEANIFR